MTNLSRINFLMINHVTEFRVYLRFLALFLRMQSEVWEELILKASEEGEGMLFNHGHHLHGLVSGTDHELTIESKNKFGWSRPLVVHFSTLPEGKDSWGC